MSNPLDSISTEVFSETPLVRMAEEAENPASRRLRAGKRGSYAIAYDPSEYVRSSFISQAEADAAWVDALNRWGIIGGAKTTSAPDRNAFFSAFVGAVITATSSDIENLGTRFVFGGEWYDLYPIRDAVQSSVPGIVNPLRSFVRSYQYGIIPLTIMDTLDDAENVEIRQSMAYRCDGPVEHAKYMFDTIDGAITLSGRVFSNTELGLVKRYLANRADKARQSAQDVGMATAANDLSTRNRKSDYGAGSTVSHSAPSHTRLNFPSVS